MGCRSKIKRLSVDIGIVHVDIVGLKEHVASLEKIAIFHRSMRMALLRLTAALHFPER